MIFKMHNKYNIYELFIILVNMKTTTDSEANINANFDELNEIIMTRYNLNDKIQFEKQAIKHLH